MITVSGTVPTWRYRSWRRLVTGTLALLVAFVAWILLLSAVIDLGWPENPAHRPVVQAVVVIVSAIVVSLAGLAAVVAIVMRSRPMIVATTDEGVALPGPFAVSVPWTAVSTIRLDPVGGRPSRRRVPVLVCTSGAIVPIGPMTSRLPQSGLDRLDITGDHGNSGAKDPRLIRFVRELRQRDPHLPQAIAPRMPRREAHVGKTRTVNELPSTATIRVRPARMQPARTFVVPVLMVLTVIFLTVVSVANRPDQIFDWGQLAAASAGTIVGTALLVAVLLSRVNGELAIGHGWVAGRRYFHRRWRFFETADLISVTLRRPVVRGRTGLPRQQSAPGIFLVGGDRRSIRFSPLLLRNGFGAALHEELTDPAPVFPDARNLLETCAHGDLPGVVSNPFVTARGFRRRARWAQGYSLVTTLFTSAYLIADVVAGVVGITHGAWWVLLPAAAAAGVVNLCLIGGWYRRRRGVQGGPPGLFDVTGQNRAPRKGRNWAPILFTGGQLVTYGAFSAMAVALSVASPYAKTPFTTVPGSLPAVLTSDVPRTSSVTPAEARSVTTALWNVHERALVNRNLALVNEVDTGALASYDSDYFRALAYGIDPSVSYPARRADSVTVFVPRQSRWPLFFAAQVASSPGARPGQATDILVATKTGPDSRWHLAFLLGNETAALQSLFLPPAVDSAGYDEIPQASADGSTGDWFPALARYYTSWKDTGSAPPGTLFQAGYMTSEEGRQLAVHRQGAQVDGGGITGTYRFRTEDAWLFGSNGAPVVCGDIYELATDTGGEQQNQNRTNWGPDVAPGSYATIVSTYDDSACIYQGSSGLIVYGGDNSLVDETGYR